MTGNNVYRSPIADIPITVEGSEALGPVYGDELGAFAKVFEASQPLIERVTQDPDILRIIGGLMAISFGAGTDVRNETLKGWKQTGRD